MPQIFPGADSHCRCLALPAAPRGTIEEALRRLTIVTKLMAVDAPHPQPAHAQSGMAWLSHIPERPFLLGRLAAPFPALATPRADKSWRVVGGEPPDGPVHPWLRWGTRT